MNNIVVPGKFRIPHKGHEWLIQQAYELLIRFEGENKLYVGVAYTTEQFPFSLEERLEVIRGITAPYENIEVDNLREGQKLVNYAREREAKYIFRSTRDLTNEEDMWEFNKDFDPNITPHFLRPPNEYWYLNSTRLIEILTLEGGAEDLRPYVPEFTYKKLLEKQ